MTTRTRPSTHTTFPATQLSVNVNKIATVRNTRNLDLPSVAALSRVALDAGAHGITIHPRPDKRHIRPDDVAVLAALVARYPGREFNIEGNPFTDYMPHIRAVRPQQATLVPDSTEQFTSDHGWDLTAENMVRLRPLVAEMRRLGCRVSLFMDADALAAGDAIKKVVDLGAHRVELYTEPYARAFLAGGRTLARSLDLYARAARRATAAGLGVNAGHDLSIPNLPPLLAAAPQILEVSIGHALIADALHYGLGETIHRYRAAIASARAR